MFCVGVNTFLCLMQVFPGTLLHYNYRDPKKPRQLLARTELQRRDEFIKLLHQQLGERHPLVLLVKQCLDDEPSKRPSAQELLRQLEGMSDQVVDPYQHLNKLEAMRLLNEKETQVEVSYNISTFCFISQQQLYLKFTAHAGIERQQAGASGSANTNGTASGRVMITSECMRGCCATYCL